MQYYSFVHNKNVLSARMYLILKSSCVKLLASKFTLGTQAAVFKKFGKKLKGSDRHAFSQIDLGISPLNFKGSSDPQLKVFAGGISKASLDNLKCAKCGSEYRVEMHHVRMMKDLNAKLNLIDKLMV